MITMKVVSALKKRIFFICFYVYNYELRTCIILARNGIHAFFKTVVFLLKYSPVYEIKLVRLRWYLIL